MRELRKATFERCTCTFSGHV